jgi:hypothetical protein
MIRGFMKTSSRTALVVAAAGMLMSAYAPAKAADIGSGCCADLEERVAELEATAARKGTRVVSLQVYGQVNKGLLVWDDGVDSDAFVVDNDVSGSRLGFNGSAKFKPGWSAGYVIEFDYQDSASDKVNNGDISTGAGRKNGDDTNSFLNPSVNGGEIYIRQNNFYIESEQVGRLTVGMGSTAADGAYEVVLGNSLRSSDIKIGNAFAVRTSDGHWSGYKLSDTPQAGHSFAGNLDPTFDQLVRYDTPSLYGFILSAAWGDNDYADVALRFKKDFGTIRVAAALAYQWDSARDAKLAIINPNTGATTAYDPSNHDNDKSETFGGSASLMHIPTGLYVAFAAAERNFEVNSTTVRSATLGDPSYWYLQGGIEKKIMPYGSTTVFGEYGDYQDFAFVGSDATRWGMGVVQKIDAAAMDVYANATFWSFDGLIPDSTATYEDMSTVIIGSRIRF